MTWAAAERKFRNLKGTYKKIVDNNNKSGRGKLGKKKWPFMVFFDSMFGKEPATDPVAVEVGVHIEDEPSPSTSAAVVEVQHNGESQEASREETAEERGKGGLPKGGKKRKADKMECPTWFANFVADFKQRDDERQAQEERRLKLMEEMNAEQAHQVAQRNAMLSELNRNIKELLEKM